MQPNSWKRRIVLEAAAAAYWNGRFSNDEDIQLLARAPISLIFDFGFMRPRSIFSEDVDWNR
jgi:hypothetical protein